MAKRLTFTRHDLTGIADNKNAARDFKRAIKELNGAFPPESLWRMANAALTEETRALSFSAHQPYIAAMREVLHRRPELRIGYGPYVVDDARREFEFVDAEVQDDGNA